MGLEWEGRPFVSRSGAAICAAALHQRSASSGLDLGHSTEHISKFVAVEPRGLCDSMEVADQAGFGAAKCLKGCCPDDSTQEPVIRRDSQFLDAGRRPIFFQQAGQNCHKHVACLDRPQFANAIAADEFVRSDRAWMTVGRHAVCPHVVRRVSRHCIRQDARVSGRRGRERRTFDVLLVKRVAIHRINVRWITPSVGGNTANSC